MVEKNSAKEWNSALLQNSKKKKPPFWNFAEPKKALDSFCINYYIALPGAGILCETGPTQLTLWSPGPPSLPQPELARGREKITIVMYASEFFSRTHLGGTGAADEIPLFLSLFLALCMIFARSLCEHGRLAAPQISTRNWKSCMGHKWIKWSFVLVRSWECWLTLQRCKVPLKLREVIKWTKQMCVSMLTTL
jgi:hypothetical protein